MRRVGSRNRVRFGVCSGAIAIATSFALGGCGGADSVSATFVSGPSLAAGGATIVATSRSVVVATDVDGDGLSDLASIARDGSGVGACWRNAGLGTWSLASDSLRTSPTLCSLRDAVDSTDDTTLASEFGVHRVGATTRAGAPYAVLHLGDGATETNDDPTVASLEPSSGPTRSLVLVHGAALSAPGEPPTVTMGGVASRVLFAFGNTLVVVVPEGLPRGPAEVRVTRGNGEAAVATFQVVDAEAPVLSSVVPETLTQGCLAVLRGEHLGSPLDRVEVSFSGAPSVPAIGLGDAALVIVPPDAVTGTVFLAVEGVASAPIEVGVGAAPTPSIAHLVPTSASVGSLVAIEGTGLYGLGAAIEVSFAGVPAALFGLGEGRLTAIVPPGAHDGPVVVTVGGRASEGFPFHVAARQVPTIDSVSPAKVGADDLVQVTGKDLVDLSAWSPGRLPPLPLFGDLRVTFGKHASPFVLPTPTGLQVVVPRTVSPGAADVRVEIDGRVSDPFSITIR